MVTGTLMRGYKSKTSARPTAISKTAMAGARKEVHGNPYETISCPKASVSVNFPTLENRNKTPTSNLETYLSVAEMTKDLPILILYMTGATGISAGTATLHGTPACAVIVVVLVGTACFCIGAPVGRIRVGAMLGFGTSYGCE